MRFPLLVSFTWRRLPQIFPKGLTFYSSIPFSHSRIRGIPQPELSLKLYSMEYKKDTGTPILGEMKASTILDNLYSFWFQHLKTEECLTLPSWEEHMLWFRRDAEFDQKCVNQFLAILTRLKDENATEHDILTAFNPVTPLDWLSLILLLDQLPRNCYRDEQAAIAFTFFDPLARAIALRALAAGVPSTSPEIRYRVGLRFWFYLPFVHSEHMADQEKARQLYEEMAEVIKSVIESSEDGLDLSNPEQGYIQTLRANQSKALHSCQAYLGSQKDHQDIIRQFGRYPYRNKALGREMTAEEETYLKEGKVFGG